MSSPMVSRWPVRISVPLRDGETDAEGRLTDAAVERISVVGRDAYFDLCTTVDRSAVEVLGTSTVKGPAAAGNRVSVSANVVEIFPDRVTMMLRVRPAQGERSVAADVRCSLSMGDEVTKAMRDEFIALAHSARHTH